MDMGIILLRCTMKKNKAILVFSSLIAIVVFYFVLILLIKGCDTFNYEIGSTVEEYEVFKGRVLHSDKYMPNNDQLINVDEFKTSYAKHFKPLELWSITESVTLTCSFANNEGYCAAKNELCSNYVFLNEQNDVLRDVSAICYGYDVRVVDESSFSISDNSYWYPHCFLMIGFDDESCKLIYMFHYNSEIDYINNLDNFINENYYLK